MSSPDILFGQLFIDVQLGRVFADSKTFVDCMPKQDPAEILAIYEARKSEPDFDLSAFIREHFHLPEQVASDYVSDTTLPTAEHINRLWDRLTRSDLADETLPHSSRLSLPHPYVVPGGRFREIFYWDSYFTMLGLRESGRTDLIRGMIDNFAYLIDTVGFIPNGNRTYFLSRSQPPFFALMVQLLAEMTTPEPLFKYLPQLQAEYEFWMQGEQELSETISVTRRVVRMPNGGVLNRYWDDTPTPRPEAYRQEVELNEETEPQGVPSETLYNHIRAACESGWDFSSRWFYDENNLSTIEAAYRIPVDLNVLLYQYEIVLSIAYDHIEILFENDPDKLQRVRQKAAAYEQAAVNRVDNIQEYLWHEALGEYFDCDYRTMQPTLVSTLAGVFPLFHNIATPEQAARIHDRLKAHFLQAGGWVTTLNHTGQQWDWPNGWAPLQWIVYQGLINYGFAETAHEGRDRWLALNDKVFRATGKMMEKYNVVDAALTTGGGEYPNQDGFGWTNGVYLALSAERDREGST
jgi:alpha,alpha-trehalase